VKFQSFEVTKLNRDIIGKSQPFFVYRRLVLAQPTEKFFYRVDQGFYYLLRDIIIKYPEIDATGAIFGPFLEFRIIQKAQDIYPEDTPIPIRLISSPASYGVAINAAGQMTATQPTGAKTLNTIYPQKDNIEIRITGQNGVTPAVVDIVLNGYLLPIE
jgi:hypothetical protein